MSRIPDAEVERLKLEVAIERLAAGAGVALGRQGEDLIGRCPFCEAGDALVCRRARTCGGAGRVGSGVR